MQKLPRLFFPLKTSQRHFFDYIKIIIFDIKTIINVFLMTLRTASMLKTWVLLLPLHKKQRLQNSIK